MEDYGISHMRLGSKGNQQNATPFIDLIVFGSENFNAQKYLEGILPPYPEEAIRKYSESLATAKSSAAVDLQKHVYKNYKDFIKISKEISKM